MKNKHSAIINGITIEKTWRFEDEIYYYNFPRYRKTVRYSSKNTETEMWSGELDFPPVNVGDKIYISETDVCVNIDEVIRTTYNEYIYKTSHVVEEFESENLESDRLEAIEEWFVYTYPSMNSFEELKAHKPTDETDEEPVKMTYKDKWREIKRILKKKYA